MSMDLFDVDDRVVVHRIDGILTGWNGIVGKVVNIDFEGILVRFKMDENKSNQDFFSCHQEFTEVEYIFREDELDYWLE